MKIFLKKTVLFVLAAVMLVVSVPVSEANAYTAPVKTVKIGLYYGSTALSSANLQNYAGYGSGYEFGYYDANREFVSLGAYVAPDKITMTIDKNLVYNVAENSYDAGTEGGVVVGCFHIRLETPYATYAEARAAADTFTSVNAFVKYSSGMFYTMAGAYISEADAAAAAATLGIQQGYTIDSGTAYTVSVVQTGTSNILFEFEHGSEYSLGVRPLMDAGGQKTQTWFKGYRWNGGFQYSRVSGGNLTVVNVVDIEDYIKGVIPYEMSASWPVEALKAQAVCARTYVMANLNAHRSYGFDCCNTTDCQVYYGTSRATANSNAAVDGTAGQYLTYNGQLCNTYYHAADGGYTENSENVWSNATPYLRAVEDVYETSIASTIPGYNWTVTYTGEELAERLRSKGYSCTTIVKFEVVEYTAAGNVYKIRFTDSTGKTISFSKEQCRTVPGAKSMRYTVSSDADTLDSMTVYVNSPLTVLAQKLSLSYLLGSSGLAQLMRGSGDLYAITGTGTLETIGEKTSANTSNPTFVISGAGSGHNVGMSQRGAYAMAKNFGKTYLEILTFYYQGTAIETSFAL